MDDVIRFALAWAGLLLAFILLPMVGRHLARGAGAVLLAAAFMVVIMAPDRNSPP